MMELKGCWVLIKVTPMAFATSFFDKCFFYLLARLCYRCYCAESTTWSVFVLIEQRLAMYLTYLVYHFAYQTGIEPATFRLTAECSNR